MSSEEEEYDGTSDEEGSETSEEYTESNVSQIHFLSGKKRKIEFEEVVNVSTEPPPPLPQYYGARDFPQLTQPDGNTHLFTSVATTSARVGFKYRSILAKLREIYLIVVKHHCYEYCQIGHHILIDNRTLDLEARHLHDESRITQLTKNLRRAEDRLSQLNKYLDGEGIEVGWEDEAETSQARTSQAGTSRGRGSRGRGSRGRTSEGGAAPPRRSRRNRGSFV
ncbi:hypothetical protein GIB67_009748 [Kingdonia uniflora]|uniref:Uncharacterized protein n=1 Tax=Kingdonia uniflora TaxID=39325 RepID=A0A7J7LB50_9MAGN|nr:hypothetical protein GIB67_009748 [Kingdonia uniflora]